MKAIEVSGQIDTQGRLVLEHLPSPLNNSGAVRVIVLYPDEISPEADLDNMSTAEVEADLRAALQEAKNGERMSLDQMWAEFEKG
jgi:hypothetical protein